MVLHYGKLRTQLKPAVTLDFEALQAAGDARPVTSEVLESWRAKDPYGLLSSSSHIALQVQLVQISLKQYWGVYRYREDLRGCRAGAVLGLGGCELQAAVPGI